jgi:CspA family cold shock protein
MIGTVLFYSIVKGQGVIEGEDHKEYKVKLEGIKGTGLRRLNEGQRVQFEIKNSPKGMSAVEVEVFSA